MSHWAAAFVLTVVIEVAVAVPLLGRLGSRAGVGRRAGIVAFASALTHPLLWIAVRGLDGGDVSWTIAVLVGEAAVIGVEAVVLVVGLPGAHPDRHQRILVAILMNVASTLVGLGLVALG